VTPPPENPPVDALGYQPPPANVFALTDNRIYHHDPLRGTVGHPPGARCEYCDGLLDADP
jgi:hypothetical protein